jgi:opacity protein-like surface antigen
MRKLLPFTFLLMMPAFSFGQGFEAWIGGGVSKLSNRNIGSLDGTAANFINLQDGWRLNFILGLNNWRFFGHEIGYSYNRTNWNVAGANTGSAVHEGGYNFLAYAIPEGKGRFRPFATAGGEFANFAFPGYSATSGGGSTKFGFNYGAGVKVRVLEIFGIRFDFRQHSLGKPFNFPGQTGRLKQNEISVGVGVML